jgi:hypothetical protein
MNNDALFYSIEPFDDCKKGLYEAPCRELLRRPYDAGPDLLYANDERCWMQRLPDEEAAVFISFD